MPFSVSHKFKRLPKRFPVGTTFVVEGTSSDDDKNEHLQVISRFVVLPGGHRIDLGGDPPGPARSRRIYGRIRGRAPPQRPASVKKTGKKIISERGTSLRHCR
jgi:hypothetical protein